LGTFRSKYFDYIIETAELSVKMLMWYITSLEQTVIQVDIFRVVTRYCVAVRETNVSEDLTVSFFRVS